MASGLHLSTAISGAGGFAGATARKSQRALRASRLHVHAGRGEARPPAPTTAEPPGRRQKTTRQTTTISELALLTPASLVSLRRDSSSADVGGFTGATARAVAISLRGFRATPQYRHLRRRWLHRSNRPEIAKGPPALRLHVHAGGGKARPPAPTTAAPPRRRRETTRQTTAVSELALHTPATLFSPPRLFPRRTLLRQPPVCTPGRQGGRARDGQGELGPRPSPTGTILGTRTAPRPLHRRLPPTAAS